MENLPESGPSTAPVKNGASPAFPPPVPLAQGDADSPGVPPETFWFRVLIGVALLGVVGAFAGRLIWRKLRVQRAQHQAAIAEQCIKEHRFAEAQRAVRTAIQMGPNDPQVLRTTARWCTLAGRPEGLSYWERLFVVSPPSLAERLEQLDFALALNRLDVSKNLLKSLLKIEPKNREVTLRVLRHNTLSAEPGSAIAAARTAVAMFPLDEQFQLSLGSQLLKQTNHGARAEGRRLLWNVGLGSSLWREAAVDALVDTKGLDRGDRELLIHALEKRVPSGLHNHLKACELRLSLVSGQPERERLWEQAEQLVDQYSGVTNQLILARWLVVNGETNRALHLLPRQSIGTNEAVAFSTLEILLRWGTVEETRALLAQKPQTLPSAIQEAVEGVLAGRQGKSAEVAGHFVNALQQAGRQPGLLFQVAALAELGGQPLPVVEALTRLAEINPSLTLQCCRRSLALVRTLDDLTTARRTVDRLAEFLPGEDSVNLERAWLDLLFNDRIEASVKVLERLSEPGPLAEQARFGLALAELRQGKAASALIRIETSAVESDRLSPRLQAVYAAVLLANDQREPARRVAQQIPLSALRSQERDLIARLL